MRTRRKRILFFFLLALSCGPQTAIAKAEALPPNLCQKLALHVPNADVAYQAGLDVRGHAVVPADMDGLPPIKLPETYTIPLTMDLFKAAGLDQTRFPFNAMDRNDINLGMLSLKGDQLFFNDQKLTETQQEQIARLCPTEKPQ